jgi:hypothetical protein
VSELIQQVLSVGTLWKTLGAFAGLAAAVGVVLSLLKADWAQNLPFVGKAITWLMGDANRRPIVTACLGALSGFLTAMAAGQGWLKSLGAAVGGLFAGATATGIHQAVDRNMLSPEAHTVADSVHYAMVQADADRKAKLAAAYARIDGLSGEELAAFAAAHPPALPTP